VAEEEFFSFLEKRRGVLDGVCVSGGEPLMHNAEEFIARIKGMGFAVKLDTNGSFPGKLKKMTESSLVDYVAMDIKNSPHVYAETSGAKKENANVLGVEKLRKNAKAKRAQAKRFDAFLADVVAEKDADRPVLADSNVGEYENLQLENLQAEDLQAEDLQTENTPKENEMLVKASVLDTLDNEKPENVEEKDVSAESEEGLMAKEGERTQSTTRFHHDTAVVEGQKKAEKPVAENGASLLSSESLYEKVLENEQVRLRIIGEYLASIGKSGVPVTCGNAGILTAPPMRAKSIADAGGMALHYFKKETGK
jgi:organic radical activating enzyme